MLLNLSSSPQDLVGTVRTVMSGWTGELGLGAEARSTWLAHLIRWVFHFLHVPPNYILGILACRESGKTCLRRSGGGAQVLGSRWGRGRKEGAKDHRGTYFS